jgi:hypothetical protein
MNNYRVSRFVWTIVIVFFILITTGCGGSVAATQPPAATAPAASEAPAAVNTEAPTAEPQVPISGGNPNALFEDDFTDPATGWEEAKFDNYFVGYHEPEYYHIEITSPNSKTTIFEPGKQSYDDFTVELQVLTAAAKTAPEGDFRYGLAFRRAGDQYYAFTISPRTKQWSVLKNSPNQLEVLLEGTDAGIHEIDVDDLLRVDAQGSNIFFHINDRLVGQITDSDYRGGQIGFYVQAFDSPATHIHFNHLTILNFEAPPVEGGGAAVLYQDDFTDPATGWDERQFDNYFVGYHEPEYYHVEVNTPNSRRTVFEPGKQSFNDFTVELDVLTAAAKTAPEGDFRYGLAFRRSGDQYYAFVISPRTKQWTVLKSSPSGLETLAEGTEAGIHDIDVNDALRIDVQGSNFLFHLNDTLISQVTDADYTGGEIGFYVETFDSPQSHIHFDQLTISEFQLSFVCNVNEVTLNMRSGPGKNFSSTTVLSTGMTVQPLGVSADRQWIKIQVQGGDEQGWVFYSPTFLTCDADVDLLPVVEP